MERANRVGGFVNRAEILEGWREAAISDTTVARDRTNSFDTRLICVNNCEQSIWCNGGLHNFDESV